MTAHHPLVACTSCGRVARHDELDDAGWTHDDSAAEGLLCGLCYHRRFSRLLQLLPVQMPEEAELPPAALAG